MKTSVKLSCCKIHEKSAKNCELKVCQMKENLANVKLVKLSKKNLSNSTSQINPQTEVEDGEPQPGAEKKEAMTRQRPAGATSTGDGEPLPGAVKTETTRRRPLPGAEEVESRPPGRQEDKTRPRSYCLGGRRRCGIKNSGRRRNQNLPACGGKLQGGEARPRIHCLDGELLPGAEEVESRPTDGPVGVTSKEAETRRYCMVPKMSSQDH